MTWMDETPDAFRKNNRVFACLISSWSIEYDRLADRSIWFVASENSNREFRMSALN